MMVQVLCERLDMDTLWHTAPYIAEFVEDLPPGESHGIATDTAVCWGGGVGWLCVCMRGGKGAGGSRGQGC